MRAHALRPAVDKQLDLVGIVIIGHDLDLAPRLPVPVREKMEHVNIVAPVALIHIIDIFWETGEVDDAEIRAACGPSVGGRFAEIVETGPDELAADKVIVLGVGHGMLVGRAPGNMAVAVG